MNNKNQYLKENNIKRKNIFNVINILILLLVIIAVTYENFNVIYASGNFKLVIVNIMISIFIIFEAIQILYVKKRNEMCNIKIENLEENNKNLLEVNDHIRCFKHDFNNIIQTLDACVDLGDINALRNYFKSLSKECHYMNSIDRLNVKGKGSPAIYSVLVNKYKLAESKDIDMNIEILVDLNVFNNKAYIVSRMLGILLDNAIEAANECDEKIINVQIIKDNKGSNKLLVIIENTYKDKDINTNKIFEKEYSTKKEKGNSGLGLWKIKEILSKDYELDLVTSKDDIMFKQQLEYYINVSQS